MRLLCGAIIGVALLGGCAHLESPTTENLRGRTIAKVEAAYGEPDRQWDGHYGLPSQDFVDQYPKVKSCFHDLPNRDLYVTYQLRNYNWHVVAHSFVPKGAVF